MLGGEIAPLVTLLAFSQQFMLQHAVSVSAYERHHV
jgi:hypothetical protein